MKLAFILETALFGLAAASCPFGHGHHKYQKARPEDSQSIFTLHRPI